MPTIKGIPALEGGSGWEGRQRKDTRHPLSAHPVVRTDTFSGTCAKRKNNIFRFILRAAFNFSLFRVVDVYVLFFEFFHLGADVMFL